MNVHTCQVHTHTYTQHQAPCPALPPSKRPDTTSTERTPDGGSKRNKHGRHAGTGTSDTAAHKSHAGDKRRKKERFAGHGAEEEDAEHAYRECVDAWEVVKGMVREKEEEAGVASVELFAKDDGQVCECMCLSMRRRHVLGVWCLCAHVFRIEYVV